MHDANSGMREKGIQLTYSFPLLYTLEQKHILSGLKTFAFSNEKYRCLNQAYFRLLTNQSDFLVKTVFCRKNFIKIDINSRIN